jgi:hypothetical protein
LSLGTNRGAIQKLINGIEEEARALIKEISTIAVYSSTGIETVWMTPYQERAILTDVIKEKLELLYGKKGIAVNR